MLITYMYIGPETLKEKNIRRARATCKRLEDLAKGWQASGGLMDEESMQKFNVKAGDEDEFINKAEKATEYLDRFLADWEDGDAYVNIRLVEMDGKVMKIFCCGDSSDGGDPEVYSFETCVWMENFCLISTLGIK